MGVCLALLAAAGPGLGGGASGDLWHVVVVIISTDCRGQVFLHLLVLILATEELVQEPILGLLLFLLTPGRAKRAAFLLLHECSLGDWRRKHHCRLQVPWVGVCQVVGSVWAGLQHGWSAAREGALDVHGGLDDKRLSILDGGKGVAVLCGANGDNKLNDIWVKGKARLDELRLQLGNAGLEGVSLAKQHRHKRLEGVRE